MKADWPTLSSPVKPKWMLSPITAMATAAVCGAVACDIIELRIDWISSMGVLLTDPLRLAEQTLWSHQQEQDEDEQGGGVLEVARDERQQRRHLDDQADDERAEQGPER